MTNTADSVVESVIDKFRGRSRMGIKKYGVTMDRTDLKPGDWVKHAQEEAMDLIVYLEKLERELSAVSEPVIDNIRCDIKCRDISEANVVRESIIKILDHFGCGLHQFSVAVDDNGYFITNICAIRRKS